MHEAIFFETPFIENKTNLIVVVDMNLNPFDNSLTVNKYTDLLIANGFVILNDIHHCFATRSATRTRNGLTSSSNTVIDYIFTECYDYSFVLSQTDMALSDYNALMLSIDNNNAGNFVSQINSFASTKIDLFQF